jgi:hypothetical protein
MALGYAADSGEVRVRELFKIINTAPGPASIYKGPFRYPASRGQAPVPYGAGARAVGAKRHPTGS